MSIILGGVTLSPDLLWRERHGSQAVVQSVRVTLGAVPVVYAHGVEKGVPVTLATTERMGWLRRSMVDALAALAAVPGGQSALDFHGTLLTVIFRHPAEPGGEPALFFEPVRRTNLAAASDWMRGEIRLLTV